MSNSTTLFRRSTGEQVGWYDETLKFSGDRDFWMKMALAGKLHNLQDYLGTTQPAHTTARSRF